ncbi:MAG: deoxyribose-phosphate aldolase [Chryseobacterium sp.]|nr:MAG: deoxyribose-phosphate aldolase [Chryseobacterium sp.]
MDIRKYLDSTYLKTPAQSGLSEDETLEKVMALTKEAVDNHLFAVMIRPEYVAKVRAYLDAEGSSVKLGTVIGFHEGTASTDEKWAEAAEAIKAGADELDFVINYQAFIEEDLDLVKQEFLACTRLCIEHGKVAKWIIEIAALTDGQIAALTGGIAKWAGENFTDEEQSKIFVKSSTGFYKTEDGKPNGATPEGIRIMLDNSGKLPVKAAGGVRTPEEAEQMITMGVQRIGTSSAMALVRNDEVQDGY